MAERWTCPDCNRSFAKKNQGHLCAPGMTEDEYFSTGPPFERPIYDEVAPFVAAFGDVHVEFVSVGVFFKTKRTFAELRPLTKWVNLTFGLPRKVEHPQISRRQNYGNNWWYAVRLRTPADVTDEVRGWLAEAWEQNS